jgi:hypothetical protein
MATLPARTLVLPTLGLAGAGLLLLPARPAGGFSKIGESLSEAQRDVRVFDNFADATANDNASSPSQFPGWSGVELAVWKAVVEWGSRAHGNGTGDPQSGNVLGNGGANFDAFWAGSASAIGNSNQNIVSAIASCNGNTLAYTELPLSDGWRIRYCDNVTFDDGPGTIGNRYDVQGIMTHEYGHALGLGHSGTNGATMYPTGSPGQTSLRSIEADDAAGVQCVYGVASVTKPVIVATVPAGGVLTIHGSNFDLTSNEVWFTSATPTTASIDPIVRVAGVPSNGSQLTLVIPPAAGPGDVLVKKPGTGGATLSNAFPTDLVNAFGTPPVPVPVLTGVKPGVIECLIPGTTRTVALEGVDLDLVSAVGLDGVALAPGRWSLENSGRILLDMPQVPTLGVHVLSISDGLMTDELEVTIVAPSGPRYELGSGDALDAVDRDGGLRLRIAGPVGSPVRILASRSAVPSVNAWIALDLGNAFTDLANGGTWLVPPAGWLEILIPSSALPPVPPGGQVLYSQGYAPLFPAPFETTGLQSILLVP